ncbi:MAG: hypothetical protein ABRQ38_26670 [Candidatus Eremiobacterota bacterium]
MYNLAPHQCKWCEHVSRKISEMTVQDKDTGEERKIIIGECKLKNIKVPVDKDNSCKEFQFFKECD